MSIRSDAKQIVDRAKDAIGRNPHAAPEPALIEDMERVVEEAFNHYISDFHPELDLRRLEIPARPWTLEIVRDLASAIYETAVKYDTAMGPALAKARLAGI